MSPESLEGESRSIRTRYTEFVVDHHTALRRVGVATFIGGIPLGAMIGLNTSALEVPSAQMLVSGIGAIEYSLGIAGRDIESRQQG